MEKGQAISFKTEKFNKGKRTVGIVVRVLGDSIMVSCMNGRSRPVLKVADLDIQYIK